MNIDKSKVEGIWAKYDDDVKVLIQLPKFSDIESGDLLTSKGQLKHFCNCVIDWEGINEGKDNIKLDNTEDNKKYLFDYYIDFREFVWGEIRDRGNKLENELKN